MDNLNLDDRFFYLNQEGLARIREFKVSRNPALIAPIFEDIVRNYLPEIAGDSSTIPMEEPFANLGLDSVSLLEIVGDLQDALDIRLADEDVRELHTFKDARTLVTRKVGDARREPSPPASSASAQ